MALVLLGLGGTLIVLTFLLAFTAPGIAAGVAGLFLTAAGVVLLMSRSLPERQPSERRGAQSRNGQSRTGQY